MQSAKEVLKAKGIRPTFQRLKILEFIRDCKEHPTVDDIYRKLIKGIPTISKTTVYNTAKTLVESGAINQVNVTGTETRFDFAGEPPHHHLVCDKCGRIIDIAIDCPYLSRREMEGHLIIEKHGYFRGICSDCRGKTENRAD
ncbi:MAG: transcriptional repressor [Endomicrobiales bacterium]|nr:transcriptional repressor [Endomicrobiales bacterium]